MYICIYIYIYVYMLVEAMLICIDVVYTQLACIDVPGQTSDYMHALFGRNHYCTRALNSSKFISLDM